MERNNVTQACWYNFEDGNPECERCKDKTRCMLDAINQSAERYPHRAAPQRMAAQYEPEPPDYYDFDEEYSDYLMELEDIWDPRNPQDYIDQLPGDARECFGYFDYKLNACNKCEFAHHCKPHSLSNGRSKNWKPYHQQPGVPVRVQQPSQIYRQPQSRAIVVKQHTQQGMIRRASTREVLAELGIRVLERSVASAAAAAAAEVSDFFSVRRFGNFD